MFMQSGMEMAREIQLTDWSMAGNLSNLSPGVQIPCDICTRLKRYLYSAKCSWIIIPLIGWLAPWADKVNQIVHYDWLPKPVRWCYLARLGLPATSYEKNFSKSQIIHSLLTKLFGSRWLDISLILFLQVYGPRLPLGPWTLKTKNLANF